MGDVGAGDGSRTRLMPRVPRVIVIPTRWIGLGAAFVLVAAAMAVPPLLDWNVHINTFPPLYADWDPRLGPGSVPAFAIALLGTLYAANLAMVLSWRRLLLLVWLVGACWMLALATVDGGAGISTILNTYNEYLRTARGTTDLPTVLRVYVDHIPFTATADWPPEIARNLVEHGALDSLDPRTNWPAHLAGHPPGALTFFVVLVRLGLGSGLAAGLVVTLIAATTAVAVLVTVRTLGAEQLARRAAPFLVLGPAAIWQSVSADAVFAAVAAWGLATLAIAATRTRTVTMLAWSVLSGLLLGYTMMLSYGLPLLGLLALTVLYLAGSWRPLVPVAVAAAAVVLAYAGLGFAWWEGIHVLRGRYWDGVAHKRPGSYWTWANLAALLCSAGPLMAAGVAEAGGRLTRGVRVIAQPERVVVLLAVAAAAAVAAADLSQMSRAEVERIWLPFVPWLLLGCALLPKRWRRRGLALQVVAALLLQHLLRTAW